MSWKLNNNNQASTILMAVSITLIISTYNWHEALELVLLSLKRQSLLPNEVIIADDGSSNKTKVLVESFQKDFPTNLSHLWHEDNGFQKSLILNKAVAKAKGDYIVQIDGDCIMHRKFIQDHVSSVEKNTYLFGSRVNLKAFIVPKLYAHKTIDFSFLSKAIINRGRSLYIPFLAKFYKKQAHLSKKVRGCNLSYWKQDYIDVNGYNEDIVGWGKEDTEFVIRMVNNNIYGKRLKFRGIVYHIWHDVFSKNRVAQNKKIQLETITNKMTWCSNGIDKYLNE